MFVWNGPLFCLLYSYDHIKFTGNIQYGNSKCSTMNKRFRWEKIWFEMIVGIQQTEQWTISNEHKIVLYCSSKIHIIIRFIVLQCHSLQCYYSCYNISLSTANIINHISFQVQNEQFLKFISVFNVRYCILIVWLSYRL
jgi:hypothetical protein